MDPATKDLCYIILRFLTFGGAVVAFVFGLRQWARSQAWQRADKLDKFIEKFESSELLRLAAAVVDWTVRETKFCGRDLVVNNEDALLALRNHEEMPEDAEFEGEQVTIRDAYDALLAFFLRLDMSISHRLIDAGPARDYFTYWLEHFLRFDRHPDPDGTILEGVTPEAKVAGYIRAYGDMESVKRLCDAFGVRPPCGSEAGRARAS